MKPPRHILMTTDTNGGVWTHTVDLCASLARYGVEVTLLALGRTADERQTEEIGRLGNVHFLPTTYRTEWMADCNDDLLRSGEVLLRLADGIRPDVIHLNGYWHACLPLEVPVLVAAHSCVSSWWKACRTTPLPPEWANYERWVAQSVARAGLLVAPTAAFLAEFQSLHGCAARARVIPNGRFAARFKPGVKRRIVLAAGRVWDDAKNIALLCKAAGDIDVPIAVAGEMVAPDGSVFNGDGLAALGRLSAAEMARWMAEAAIFAAPARYEPSGLSILEAALSGCALILSDIPTLRELWDGAATFIDPDDVQGLRRAIRMLSEMPQLAASDGRKARERAAAYTAERMGDLYWRAYQDLMIGNTSAVLPAGDVAA